MPHIRFSIQVDTEDEEPSRVVRRKRLLLSDDVKTYDPV